MMEKLLHYVWKHRLFPLQPLRTEDGQPVEVIDTGRSNMHAGPDFTGAKVRIGDMLWAGNVEIHVRASDWMRHGHDTDRAYDTVILHVVSAIDAHPVRTDGSAIPQLALPYPDGLKEKYEELMRTDRFPPCYSIIRKLPLMLVHSWLTALGQERFAEKTSQTAGLLSLYCGDWERALFVSLSRSFGFGVNGDAFEKWAKSVPLHAVGKHRDSLFQIEAIFFGMSGLLDPSEAGDEYSQGLAREFAYLRHKFSLDDIPDCQWRFLRLRPGNFPHVRIAQLASLYHASPLLMSAVREAEDLKTMRSLFSRGTSEYWMTHCSFGKPTPRRGRSLSRSSVDSIIINTVLPMLFAYGTHYGNECLRTRALTLLEEMKPEDNHILRLWGECGLEAQNAADSQALIQLKKNYCDTRKCLYCRFGYEYFKNAPYRCSEVEAVDGDKSGQTFPD